MAYTGKFIKIASIIVGIIILLGILIYGLTGFFLEPYVRDKIINKLQKINKVEYDVNVEKLNIQTLGGNIYMEGIELIPVHAPGVSRDAYKIFLSNLNIEGLDIYNYVFANRIEINSLEIDNPTISFYQYKDPTTDTTTQIQDKGSNNIKSIEIDHINLNGGKVKIINVDKESSNLFLTANVTISGEALKYDLSEKLNKALSYDSLASQVSNLEIKTADSLRLVNIENIILDGKQRYASVNEINISTRLGKYQLGEYLGHEADWINGNIPTVHFSDWKIETFLAQGSFETSKIEIQQPVLTVFRDLRNPFPEKPNTKLPYDFLQDLKMSISIDTLQLRNADVTYQEHVKGIDEYGEITLKQLRADITNITNDSSSLEKNGRKGYMTATAMLMGVSELKAEFVFDLNENPSHEAKGSLAAMDLEKINPMISKVGYARIKSGRAKSMNFNFTYNEDVSNGEMKFLYENLEIEILSQEDGGDKDLISFIADFVIDDENIGDDIRIGNIKFQRHKKKSLINYWWKSLLTGILNSVGAEKKAESVQ